MFKKLLKDTLKDVYYPFEYSQYFINGIPKFIQYFLEVPSSYHSKIHHRLYWLSGSFIFYPIKNLFLLFIEFPLMLIVNALKYAFYKIDINSTKLRFCIRIFQSIFTIFVYIIKMIFCPIETFIELAHINQYLAIIYITFHIITCTMILSSLIAMINPFLSSLIAIINPFFIAVAVDDLNTIYNIITLMWYVIYIYKFTVNVELASNNIPQVHDSNDVIYEYNLQKFQNEHGRFLEYNPNTMLCPISGESLGFIQNKNQTSTIIKWGNVYCLKDKVPVNILQKYAKDIIIVPTNLTYKLNIKNNDLSYPPYDIDLVSLDDFTELDTIVRTPYGHYFTIDSIHSLIKHNPYQYKENTCRCPTTKKLIRLEDVRNITHKPDNQLSQQLLAEIANSQQGAQNSNVSCWRKFFNCPKQHKSALNLENNYVPVNN